MRFAAYLITMMLAVPAVLAAPGIDPQAGKSGHKISRTASGRAKIQEIYDKDMPEHQAHLIDNQDEHPENKGPFVYKPGSTYWDDALEGFNKKPGDERREAQGRVGARQPPQRGRLGVTGVKSLDIKEQPKEGGLAPGTARLSNQLKDETGKTPLIYPVARGRSRSPSPDDRPSANTRNKGKATNTKTRRSLVERRALRQPIVTVA